jgi:predicted CXXCH cytochrome family protein
VGKDRLLSLRRLILGFCVLAALACLGGVVVSRIGSIARAADAPPPPAYVGSAACAACHPHEAQLWAGSHHKAAMDHATDASALGDFNNATFEHFGVPSRFYRRDGKFLVETDGPDGKLAEFEIRYTFGVYPLQQYLIAFPDGRLQALGIAWDSRPKDKGGQRWFSLHPGEPIPHDDPLHWTGLNQNWNFMCAECHSTGVRKNYDAGADTFATTWAEISVGCETCHGQGSAHVAWAKVHEGWRARGGDADPKGLLVRFDERAKRAWAIDPATGNAVPSAEPATLRKEVETCGLCHARRGQIAADWVPGRWLSDTHVVEPLSRGLYFADGQMEDEVYNYGSFKESRMFAKGVTCGDCHDPHSTKLKAPGDGVCLQCHAPDKYAVAAHSRHEAANPPVGCPDCHMPTRTYMVVHARHDHGFRVPRPDLSARLGTPNACNACNACHADKTAQWAADAVQSWHGPDRKGFPRYAAAFHDTWTDAGDAEALMTEVVSNRETPGFVRAGALAELQPFLSDKTVGLARAGLADSDPMVRIGALDMLEGAPAEDLWPIVAPLMSDPVRGVRVRAVDLLAALPPASRPEGDRAAFDRAAAEFVAAQRLNADRPEARLTLGSFYARERRTAEAEAEYKAALKLAPQFAPAAINLADLDREIGRDADGEAILRAALAASPGDAGLHSALGLALVRMKRPAEALGELERAAALAPDNPQNAYVYGVALNSAGRAPDALRTLAGALERHPDNRLLLTLLTEIEQQQGDLATALGYAERLARITPDDANLKQFVERLRTQAKAR